MKAYHRRHYLANKDLYLVRKSQVKKAAQEYIRELKKDPCMDCGKKYPYYVMDFDHIDPSTKLNTISKMILCSSSLKKIMEEINKCEVVCSNCHRIRTYNRRLGKMPEPGLLGQS